MADEKQLDERTKKLEKRLAEIKALEKEIKDREKKLSQRESARKQIVLRISPTLWNDISEWAEQDFRSINGQIEYILTEAVRKKKSK